jgi:excisionase family DNA binding protein
MSPDGFLTTREVIRYLNVNVRTLYRLVTSGKIPAIRVGRQWRFKKIDLDAYIAAGRPSGRSTGPARVLVADDDPEALQVIARALSEAGHEVDAVADGPSAVERLRQGDYQLLLTDLSMPGMSGLAVIREARRHYGRALPIGIITGHSTEACAIEAVNLAVAGYLLKPCRPAQIVRIAARLLGAQAVVT